MISWPLRLGYAATCAGAAVPYSVSGSGGLNTFEIVISIGFVVVVVALLAARIVHELLDDVVLLSVGLWVAACVYVALEADTGTAEKWSLALVYGGLAAVGYAIWLLVRRRAV